VYYESYAKVTAKNGDNYLLSITQIFRAIPHPEQRGQFKATTQEYSYRLMAARVNDSETGAHEI
jgi:hypothetical protein